MKGDLKLGLTPLSGIACSRCGTHTNMEGVCPSATCWTNYKGMPPKKDGPVAEKVAGVLEIASEGKSEIFDCLYEVHIRDSILEGKLEYNGKKYDFRLQYSTTSGEQGRKVLFEKKDIEIYIGERKINYFEESLITKINVAAQTYLMQELFWKNDKSPLAQS